MIDLSNPLHAYILGLIQTDGNIQLDDRHGRMLIELNEKDEDILLKIKDVFKDGSIRHRFRTTNFKSINTASYSIFNN